jgi:hypothetical protein
MAWRRFSAWSNTNRVRRLEHLVGDLQRLEPCVLVQFLPDDRVAVVQGREAVQLRAASPPGLRRASSSGCRILCHRVELGGELRIPVTDQELQAIRLVLEVHRTDSPTGWHLDAVH